MGDNDDSPSLYVSNLSYNSTEACLRTAFPLSKGVYLVKDRNSGQFRGFGFVKFETDADVKASLDMVGGPGGTLHLDGRDVRVNHAYSKEQKRSDGSTGGGGGGAVRGGPRGGGGGFRGRGGVGSSRGGGGGRGGYGGGFGQNGGSNWSDQNQGSNYNWNDQSSSAYTQGQTPGYGQGQTQQWNSSQGQAQPQQWAGTQPAAQQWNSGQTQPQQWAGTQGTQGQQQWSGQSYVPPAVYTPGYSYGQSTDYSAQQYGSGDYSQQSSSTGWGAGGATYQQ